MNNIGLISYGYWTPNIARNPNISLKINFKWTCDKNHGRIEKAKSKYLLDNHKKIKMLKVNRYKSVYKHCTTKALGKYITNTLKENNII
jgi:hypothetical protein